MGFSSTAMRTSPIRILWHSAGCLATLSQPHRRARVSRNCHHHSGRHQDECRPGVVPTGELSLAHRWRNRRVAADGDTAHGARRSPTMGARRSSPRRMPPGTNCLRRKSRKSLSCRSCTASPPLRSGSILTHPRRSRLVGHASRQGCIPWSGRTEVAVSHCCSVRLLPRSSDGRRRRGGSPRSISSPGRPDPSSFSAISGGGAISSFGTTRACCIEQCRTNRPPDVSCTVQRSSVSSR